MDIKNICVKKSYTTKDGQEKNTWPQVGVLKTAESGKQYIELNMFPGAAFYVFDQKEKKEKVINLDAPEMSGDPEINQDIAF